MSERLASEDRILNVLRVFTDPFVWMGTVERVETYFVLLGCMFDLLVGHS